MKRLLKLLLLISLLSCEQKTNQSNKPVDTSMEFYDTFDKNNHLQPLFDKKKFDTLHSWDFGWAVLEPISISKGDEDEKLLAKRFSAGQKTLYFIWYLDAEVTNGGFIQFYWNGYRKYIPPILDGLKLIGDTSMSNLVQKADKEYLAYQGMFTLQRQKDDWEPLYDSLKNFEKNDSVYYATHDTTMELIERYARQHPEEFVRFK
jgi:hypothetical protein